MMRRQNVHASARRRPHIVAYRFPPFVAWTCSLIAVVLGPFLWFHLFASSGETYKKVAVQQSLQRFSSRLGAKGSQRIAIIIPFISASTAGMPTYLELFCTAAAGSAPLVDFLIFHNGALDGLEPTVCPFNVKLISLETTEKFVDLALRVLDRKEDAQLAIDRNKLSLILTRHMLRYPYVLVELKPALGHIFADYIAEYTHWGYSDLDIIFGDLPRWITRDEITDFDIVTYGFGDQHRLYLRGQFTFHKNTEEINQLWRGCDYLSHMDERFYRVLKDTEKFRFESAEGCYSSVILQQTNIKVKYAVKAFTDVKSHDTASTHGVHIALGTNRDRTVLYKAGSPQTGVQLARLSSTWFEAPQSPYSLLSKSLQSEIGSRESLALVATDEKCMYWARKEYQRFLCNDELEASDTVFWINGQLFKQKYETMEFPNNIASAPFFHFQEWKRYYRRSPLVAMDRSGIPKLFEMGKDGIIPIYDNDSPRRKKRAVPSPLGVAPSRWKSVKRNYREQLPTHLYCLRSGPREFPPTPPAPQCQLMMSWRDNENVQILSGAPGWTQIDPAVDVTMALTLQINAEQANDGNAVRSLLTLIANYLDSWQGQPSVLVVHVAGGTDEIKTTLENRLGPTSNLSFGLESCLVALILSENGQTVSRKALMNMATDASPTRWVVSGFELERGLVMSRDMAFFTHRASRIHMELPGSVFILPQFGFTEGGEELTLSSVFAARAQEELRFLTEFDEDDCQSKIDRSHAHGAMSGNALSLWWELSSKYVHGQDDGEEGDALTEEAVAKRVKALEDMQVGLMELLSNDKHFNLFAMDVSPILMVDHMGPREGMKTSLLAREVEEFAGMQCYNGLRLAQLAMFGYHVNVLPGAFAASTPTTRKLASRDASNASNELGISRCDGCFLFDEQHEDILEGIAKDERHRPAKAAVLWYHTRTDEHLEGHT